MSFHMMLLLQFIMSMLGTIAFAVLFIAPKKEIWLCGLTGAIGWCIYYLMVHNDINMIFATVFSALVLTLVSRSLAVIRRIPVTVYLICAIFPLVPGSEVYYTAYYLFLNYRAQFFNHGLKTFEIAGAIVFGIILGMAIPQKLFKKLAGGRKKV